MNVVDRFIKYVQVDTPSDEHSDATPSSNLEFDLAKILVEELKELGVQEVECDELCYVYGKIPATKGYENKTKIGFVAHMDTSFDFSGIGVKPRIIRNYDGEEIILGTSGRTLNKKTFKHLPTLIGKDLIVTDGTTLLGGDDKAGIAEIMTAIDELNKSNIPHGPISICFTPDEEIGRGADHFSVEKFGAEYAYTLDGGAVRIVEYENFNAAGAVFDITGVNVHPGSAKNIMVNSQLVAMEINSMLPQNEVPSKTEGYEGFYHLTEMSGNTEKSQLSYIIRDHSDEIFEKRINVCKDIAKKINEKYGEGTVVLTVVEQYRNMKSVIVNHFHLIENAKEALKAVGIEPEVEPVRGGTDGARLSFMGLPCPNLGTGDYLPHGPFEHVCIQEMESAVKIVLELIKTYSK